MGKVNIPAIFRITRGIRDLHDFYQILKRTNANFRDKDTGETPLIRASRHGYYEFVEALLNENNTQKLRFEDRYSEVRLHADISLRDYEGNTALCAAAKSGFLSVVQLLSERMGRVDNGAR